MAQTHFLPLPNTDLISSFTFNYHGTRLAVSSLDHHLYVLSSDPETGNWPQDLPSATAPQEETRVDLKNKRSNLPNLQSWTAHEGPVLKVVWSEPPHEELLASAGTDGIRIWEEHTRRQPASSSQADRSQPLAVKDPSGSKPGVNSTQEPIIQWRQQAFLADSHGHVRDLAFSPSETSLKLASISSDHHLRLYECLESNSITGDNWNMIIKLDLSVLPPNLCTSTNHLNPIVQSSTGIGGVPFVQHPAFTSIRGFDPSGSLNSQKHGLGSNSHNITSPLSGLRSTPTPTLSSLTSASNHNQTNQTVTSSESSSGWALSWCPETYWGDILAVSAGPSGLIRVIKLTAHSQWDNFANLSAQMSTKSGGSDSTGFQAQTSVLIPSPITSLAWAPPCARDYHLIAAGHRDGRARIWKLRPPSLNSLQSNQASGTAHWQAELEAELEDHVIKKPSKDRGGTDGGVGGGVGKCDWNVTGTVLSTSGSDGKVRIWKMGYTSRWINTGEITCDGGEDDDGNEIEVTAA
ncbi:hypothetical protein CROQUDRAFT_653830 [Cronartium quercuum f. sp. fusiforme G11]|uniref:WD40 repeat-like protein n=1 Tax=Cronartium quercuum f. sp. fusiforme G11 TaxID=708437 RepID=A0A9P6TG04_9BASI|nr:hypothetical protein CROQUDRAFT_653830 [Cronartium quercuum f. sp. fusiforme G11]